MRGFDSAPIGLTALAFPGEEMLGHFGGDGVIGFACFRVVVALALTEIAEFDCLAFLL